MEKAVKTEKAIMIQISFPALCTHMSSVKFPIFKCLMNISFQMASYHLTLNISRTDINFLNNNNNNNKKAPSHCLLKESPTSQAWDLEHLPFISNSPRPFLAPNCLHYKAQLISF